MKPNEILDAFIVHFGGQNVVALSAADWHTQVDNLQGNFGWNYPYVGPEGMRFYVSPEVIAHHLRGVDEIMAGRYVETICWMADRYMEIAYPGGILDPEYEPDVAETHIKVENEFYDEHRLMLEQISKIQIQALDI